MRLGSAVTIRAVSPRDLAFLYELLTTGTVGQRWRFRGASPSPDQFEHALWAGVLCHFVALRGDEPVGYACCFNAVHDAGHAEIGLAIVPHCQGTSAVASAGSALVQYVFDGWNMRKLYARVPGYNTASLRFLRDFGWAQEGILRDHCYGLGQFWSESIFAIGRDDWVAVRARHARVFGGTNELERTA